MSILKNLVETQEFATLPNVAAKVLQILEKDDVDFRELSHIIEADAPLTIKVLRVANSPIYATRTKITNINQALMTLGLNRLTNIVLGVSIFSRFLISSQKYAQEFMQKFWWHSSCTGIVAKALATKLKASFREYEFIGGLLHDIGKLAMIQYDAVKYSKVINNIFARRIRDVAAEYELYEVDHIDVGAEICKMWKMPEAIFEVVAYQNNPSQAKEHKALVAVVRFSDLLCEMWGADVIEGYDYINLEEDESYIVLCEIYPELKQLDLVNFTFELENEFKKSTEFLNALISE